MGSKEIIRHTFPEVLDIITPKRVGDYWFIGQNFDQSFNEWAIQTVQHFGPVEAHR